MLGNVSEEKLVRAIYKERKSVYDWVKINSGSKQDAEDVLQESIVIYLQLLEAGKVFDVSNPMALVMVIAKRLWIGRLRKRHVMHVPLDEAMLNSEQQEVVDASVEAEEDRKRAALALHALGDKCKDLLRLFYFEKKDMNTIANILGFRNEHVARSMKFKCLEKARQLVANKMTYEIKQRN